MNDRPKTASLYVLVFPEQGLLKVGKANNVRGRGRALEAAWGGINYAESYELRTTTSMALKLEKSLHCLLANYRATVVNGDGYTEMFRMEALTPVLRHIELFVASNADVFALHKGIPVPAVPTASVSAPPKEDLKGAKASYAIGRIGPMAWAVYSILGEHAGGASPSVTDLAETIGVSNDTVIRAMHTLTEFNLVQVVKSRGKRNVYFTSPTL